MDGSYNAEVPGKASNVQPASLFDASNVADAVVRVRPWGVDVSTGVEISRGIKSAELMDHFFRGLVEEHLRSAPVFSSSSSPFS